MKQILLLFLTITCLQIFAQVPQGMNYQAIVRDGQGNVITNHAVGFKFNIRQGSGSGAIVYAETQTPTTDQFGGVALVIGKGTAVSGSFTTINWASGIYFNEVLIDATGGANYVSMGASQLMSVPYALYAKNASGSSYTVKFNGVPITDSTINEITMMGGWGGYSAFLTENNYWYQLLYGTNSSSTIGSDMLTTDTVLNSTVFYLNDYPSTTDVLQGYVTYIRSQMGDGFYYIPLTTVATNVSNLYRYNHTTGHYAIVDSGNARSAFQMLPNNPSVTGFNLTFPVKVTIER